MATAGGAAVRRGPTRLSDPVPGGWPGDVPHAQALATQLATTGVRGSGIAPTSTPPASRASRPSRSPGSCGAPLGVGMSPVFDTFLADDSIVTTDVLGGPDGDLRLFPDLARLVVLAGNPAGRGHRSTGSPGRRAAPRLHPHVPAARGRAGRRGRELRAAIEVEWALGRGDAPPGEFVPR